VMAEDICVLMLYAPNWLFSRNSRLALVGLIRSSH
jgi:hypothetical protein